MDKEAQRRISLSLPELLIEEIDKFAKSDGQSRNKLIVMAIKQYVCERRRIELKNQMKKGYLEMGDINLDIATESLLSDESALNIYEEFLSESEESDCKTW